MLLETIRICRRKAENLPWHQQRLERSQKALFGQAGGIVLQELELPGWLGPGLYKCRILYDTQIRQLEFQPYFPKEIQTVALVRNNDISYPHKFADRRQLYELLKFSGADEIIIAKNGLITDSSFSNLAFSDGSKWFTPATPLLAGTCRARLIEEGRLTLAEIKIEDLPSFKSFKLINAMLPLDESRPLPISIIRL
ncbi:MAG: aminotransferase class IV family protein [Saprospiraceae bacterium]